LGKLRVAFCKLLENGLKHGWLLLDELSELLEVRAVSQKINVGRSAFRHETCGARTSTSATSSRTSAASTGLTRLRCGFKEIDRLISGGRGSGSGWGRLSRLSRLSWRRRSRISLSTSSWSGLSLFSLDILGNAAQKIFDCSVWVEKSGSQGTVYLWSGESHGLHFSDCRFIAVPDEES
jgi:hypothetical protein